ncbi:MAG: DUF2147 domain-containing protein [Proteobacteria bacterium]|nr:DUF2147 domain-containing protein [Pseudomonadota bacterium]MBW3616242.1 DUF2147 domain-containing protein [Pseudomonadota bacterium]
MKVKVLAGVLAAAAIASAAEAQQGVQGDWMTEGGQAKVRIGPCEGQPAQLCGRFVNPKTGGLAKTAFLTGFKPSGANKWGGGKIANPQDGKTYNSKMTLNPNGTLSVSGCVLVICKAQTWRRAPS